MPQVLALVWELVKSDYPSYAKATSILHYDEVLGLNLWHVYEHGFEKKPEKIPANILSLVEEREQLRKEKRFPAADQLRNKIKKLGYDIQDKDDGTEEVKSAAR